MMNDNMKTDDVKAGRSTWGEFPQDADSDKQDRSKFQGRSPKGKVLLELPRSVKNETDVEEGVKTMSVSDEKHRTQHRLPKGKILMEPPPSNEDVEMEVQPPAPKEEEATMSDSSENEESLEGEDFVKNRILSCVSRSKQVLFFKNQQRGEPNLSRREKRHIASALLHSNPGLFLSRYGKCLEPSHLSYFHQFRESYEVDFYLKQLEKSSTSKAKVVKNRRYQAMQELISKGEYFSMAEMRTRNPLLFEHLVERHMTAEEKEEVLPPQDATCDLSTILMAHMDRDQHSSVRRREQEAERMAWTEGEPSDEEDVESELDDEEKELLRQEFITSMQDSFLEGRDREFDYTTVDENQQYDDIVLSERDAEERYFDAD